VPAPAGAAVAIMVATTARTKTVATLRCFRLMRFPPSGPPRVGGSSWSELPQAFSRKT
jgi:hypothetical protein